LQLAGLSGVGAEELADAKITAPMDGFIKERLVSEGVYLKVNSPVVTLVQNSPLKLRFDVRERADSVRVNGRSSSR